MESAPTTGELLLDCSLLSDIGWARLRALRSDDVQPLAELANDHRIWRNLTHQFPHPYTTQAAEEFLADQRENTGPIEIFAFEVGETQDTARFAGVIGMSRITEPADHENLNVISFGYWLGSTFWGRGLATAGTRAYLSYLITTFQPRRIEAKVFGWNPASARVLEKCGLRLEGRLRSHVVKGADVTDELVYGFVVGEDMLTDTPAA